MVIVILGCVFEMISCYMYIFFLSEDLQIKFAVSYDATNLLHCVRFYYSITRKCFNIYIL